MYKKLKQVMVKIMFTSQIYLHPWLKNIFVDRQPNLLLYRKKIDCKIHMNENVLKNDVMLGLGSCNISVLQLLTTAPV